MTDPLKERPIPIRVNIASLLIGISATIAASAALANEGGEVFALTGQPTVLFDGGSGPLMGVYNGIPYEIIQGFAIAQGDMVLGRVLANGDIEEKNAQTRGIGQSSAFERWSDGIIAYQFDDNVLQSERDRAQEAIAKLNSRTSIKLVARTPENASQYKDFINFELSGGCASYVGRKGGEQTVWIAESCTVGSIVHEIGHAIGLFHEHTRPDRDNYVTVHLSNVSEGKELNFDKIEVGANNYSDYDYGSIMHYGEHFFSRNGDRSISVPDGVRVGQRDALSDHDIRSINAMYATDLTLSVSTEASDENTRVDIVVANQGSLGAHTLQVTAQWGDNPDWLSMSTGSGWDCQQVGPELQCNRATLIENSDSSFSILVDDKDVTLDELKITLQSRTEDKDLSNNAFNDSADAEPGTTSSNDTDQSSPAQDSLPKEATTQVSESTDNSTTSNSADTPDQDNAQTESNTGTEVPQTGAAQPTESDSGGGGGAAFYLLMLAFGASLRQRRSVLTKPAH